MVDNPMLIQPSEVFRCRIRPHKPSTAGRTIGRTVHREAQTCCVSQRPRGAGEADCGAGVCCIGSGGKRDLLRCSRHQRDACWGHRHAGWNSGYLDIDLR